ncbi:MAG: hypothetical protein E4H14_11610 [Candidatus Thorarchaeota archaeon]|nr:MAG: hypothetical protein E4H14_11610 [Candidatus Thorarchaeota archaeon]
MKVQYKNWEPGKKYEEVQARIYTKVSGIPVNPEQIGPRNDGRGVDATRYAFTEDGEPLAYITSDVVDENQGRVLVGYPWSLPGCPVEVKDKLLNDMIEHLKTKETTRTIITSVVLQSKTSDDQIAYFKERGFVEDENGFTYNKDFDVELKSKEKFDGPAGALKAKIATDNDLDVLIALTKEDPRMSTAFPNDDAYESYFKERVLKDGHAVILFDGEIAVAASAPLLFKPDGRILQGDEDRIIMRFTSIELGYGYAWKRLLVEIAKSAKDAGWNKTPIRVGFGFSSQDPLAVNISSAIPEIVRYSTNFVYRGDNKKE